MVSVRSVSVPAMILLLCLTLEIHSYLVRPLFPVFETNNTGCSLPPEKGQREHALYEATMAGNETAARCLIDAGTNVSADVSHGFTPLHACANTGHVEMCRLLIQAGADVNAKDTVVGLSPLHAAIGHNKLPVATLFLESNADVNALTKYNVSPLQMAVLKGSPEMVQLLLDKGADLNSRDNFENTPLHVAAMRGRLPIVQMLVERGANVQATNAFFKKPFEVASSHPDVVAWLSNH